MDVEHFKHHIWIAKFKTNSKHSIMDTSALHFSVALAEGGAHFDLMCGWCAEKMAPGSAYGEHEGLHVLVGLDQRFGQDFGVDVGQDGVVQGI